VVARAITHELELVKRPDAVVYLDLTHLRAAHIRERFPMIYTTCMRYNIDIATELVPIRPAAHYAMGGVRTDLWGRTSLPGLYAAGEVACTGVHGANRLASNSLLEGLVYGARAADTMRQESSGTGNSAKPVSTATSSTSSNGQGSEVEKLVRKAQSLMWQHVGVVRGGKALQQVVPELQSLKSQLPSSGDRRSHEAANILETGLLIARSALARVESRGAHYRLDHPLKDDRKLQKHSVVCGDNLSFQ
jgi:L-aspartate oxidase